VDAAQWQVGVEDFWLGWSRHGFGSLYNFLKLDLFKSLLNKECFAESKLEIANGKKENPVSNL